MLPHVSASLHASTHNHFRLRQVLFAMLADSTMGCEVGLCHASLAWPYLSELSLVSAIVSIFVPSWCTGPAKLADTLALRIAPWLYFNLLVQDSQVRGGLRVEDAMAGDAHSAIGWLCLSVSGKVVTEGLTRKDIGRLRAESVACDPRRRSSCRF
jgi:hypothetical protein